MNPKKELSRLKASVCILLEIHAATGNKASNPVRVSVYPESIKAHSRALKFPKRQHSFWPNTNLLMLLCHLVKTCNAFVAFTLWHTQFPEASCNLLFSFSPSITSSALCSPWRLPKNKNNTGLCGCQAHIQLWQTAGQNAQRGLQASRDREGTTENSGKRKNKGGGLKEKRGRWLFHPAVACCPAQPLKPHMQRLVTSAQKQVRRLHTAKQVSSKIQ